MAHITGGGLTDNLPRILPKGSHAFLRVGSWEVPELFELLQVHGQIERDEMFRVFNMGIGMVLAIDPANAGEILARLRDSGLTGAPIGTVREGGSGVVYDLPPDAV